jgi:hypothetical protein
MHRAVLVLTAAIAALPLLLASAALPAADAVDRGVIFIRTTQQPDGGFGGSGPGQTFDAVFAIRAAGVPPSTVMNAGKSPADFLAANAATVAGRPAIAAKAALAARAMSLDPRSVAGVDLVAAVTGALDAATGRYAADDFGHAIAMLGLACTNQPVVASANTALRSAQLEDGSWGFQGTADPDTTAIAIQALIAAGVPASDASIAEALGWVRANQGADGGWGFDPSASNASSTAYVVQALLAAGEDPESATYTKNGATPVSYLLSQQEADGAFAGFDRAFATNQVVPALAGRTFCNAAVTALAPPPALTPTASATSTGVTPTPTKVATPGTPPGALPTPVGTVATQGPAATATRPATTVGAAPQPPATGSGRSNAGSPAVPAALALLGLGGAASAALFFGRRR